VLTNRQKVAIAIERARKLAAQTRMAIREARRVVIDAQHVVTVSRSTRHVVKTWRAHHFLPK
jgi:hypothetical protein